jgi:succinate dehydrogenase / fumarate reductase cytochrome b subunit
MLSLSPLRKDESPVSEHATPTAHAQATGETLIDKHYFLFRRLHSLTGVLPIGVFVIEHLITNSQIMFGAHEYEKDVKFILGLPALLMMEIFGIWLPLAFHACLGVAYTFSGRPNVKQYNNADNWRYTMMRVTGIIALVYIFVHLSTLRWGWSYGGLIPTPFEKHNIAGSTAAAVQHAWPWMAIFYVIGTLSVVYHFANGLWTFAITWGLTVTPGAQRRWGYVCAALGLGLAVAGVSSIINFSLYDIEANRPVAPFDQTLVQPMDGGAAPVDAAAPAPVPTH